MKPFLGIDITEDTYNELENGREFLVAEPSSELRRKWESVVENELSDVIHKAQLPLMWRVVQMICAIVGFALSVGLFKAMTGEDGVGLAQSYQNAPWLFWLAGGCLALFAMLSVCASKQRKRVLESDESEAIFNTIEAVSEAIYRELEVPATYISVDVLSFHYKIKNGALKVCESPSDAARYENRELDMYVEEDRLCMVDLNGKYALPLSSLRRIRMETKRIVVSDWNKEENPNKGMYKEYKLSMDDNGCVHMKSYAVLEFEHNGEWWGMYIPPYELAAIEQLSGLCVKAEKEQE